MEENGKAVDGDQSHSPTAVTAAQSTATGPDVIMIGDDASPSGGGGGSLTAAAAEDRVKGPWSPVEDAILSSLVKKWGPRNWSLIAQGIAGRSGKSCRLRWCNQLAPYVKRKPFTGNFVIFPLKLGQTFFVILI